MVLECCKEHATNAFGHRSSVQISAVAMDAIVVQCQRKAVGPSLISPRFQKNDYRRTNQTQIFPNMNSIKYLWFHLKQQA